MKQIVCVSGPHGGGKTTLIERLIKDTRFKEPKFEIDFLSQFGSFSKLADWERSLIRLYHRVFMSSLTVDREDGRTVLTSRGPLDSEAYITAYYRLGWISDSEYQVLSSVLSVIPEPVPTILLSPSSGVIQERLEGRIAQSVRSHRDKVFSREDSPEFVTALRDAFMEAADRPNVLLVSNNEDADIERIIAWVGSSN
ncbi:hypothetical protein [Paenarthrobacter nicotinovorans]|uniref:hypothetical protein n=1 Tax=Paenarthrobacter nicotinovorans TaxID=29320 RepID=UPI003D66A27A